VTRRPGATEVVRRIVGEHRLPWTLGPLALSLALAVDESARSSRGRESRPVLLGELARLVGTSDRVRAEEIDALRSLR